MIVVIYKAVEYTVGKNNFKAEKVEKAQIQKPEYIHKDITFIYVIVRLILSEHYMAWIYDSGYGRDRCVL